MTRIKALVFLTSLLALGATLQPNVAHACDGNKKGADVSSSADKPASPPAADQKDAAGK